MNDRTYKLGDKLIYHSKVNGNDYDIEIVNINEHRPPQQRYGVDTYCEGVYYGDVLFLSKEFLDKCEVKNEIHN